MELVRVGRQVAAQVRVSRTNYLRFLDMQVTFVVGLNEDPLAVIRPLELPTQGRLPRPKKESRA
jgi:hypothetical protein